MNKRNKKETLEEQEQGNKKSNQNRDNNLTRRGRGVLAAESRALSFWFCEC